MQLRASKRLVRGITIAAACLLAMSAGVACLHYSFADPLSRLSYDVPFWWRAPIDTHEIVIVYLDAESAKELNQPIDDVWNRQLQAQLLDRLTEAGGRLVFYDVVFDQPSSDPARDAAFAQSIQRNGKVILGGALDLIEPNRGVKEERTTPPLKSLRKAAAGWGLLAFKPTDPDY